MPAGTIAYTNPAGAAFPGSKIALYVSTGAPVYQAPAPAPKPSTPDKGKGKGKGKGKPTVQPTTSPTKKG